MGGCPHFSVENGKVHKIGTGLVPCLCTPTVLVIIGVLGTVSNDLEKHLDRIGIP